MSDQLQSQARANVDMFTWGRIVLSLLTQHEIATLVFRKAAVKVP